MNLREFCQIRSYPEVLLTTYSFDPLFFERVVMADLVSGGSTRITVLVDASQALPAIETVQNQLYHLGRRYRLIPVHTVGAFHPKLCIRLSKTGAVVACSSSNLTRSGWLGRQSDDSYSGNRELTTALQILPGMPGVSALQRIRDELLKLPLLPSQLNAVYETLDQSWLDETTNSEWVGTHLSVTGVTQSLSQLLETRWHGRQFTKLRFITGSTDRYGKMIQWASETFGIKHAEVHVDLESCRFSSEALNSIDTDVKIVPYDSRPRTHIKLAVFEAADGTAAAVAGSVNCSDSAWLRPHWKNGNIEAVAIYDTCDPKNLKQFFRDDAAPVAIEDIDLSSVSAETNNSEVESRPLKSIQLDLQSGRLYVDLDFATDSGDKLFVVVADSRVPLHQVDSGLRWASSVPDLPQHLHQSLFGHVEIESTNGTTITNQIWVDDVDALARSAERKGSTSGLGRLARPGTSDEYQQLLNDLRTLTSTLLDSPEDYSDGIRSQTTGKQNDEEENASPVSADSLLRSLSTLDDQPQQTETSGSAFTSLSLTGIMRLLFAESESGNDVENTDPSAIEAQKSLEENDQDLVKDKDDLEPEKSATSEIPTEEQGKRLLDDLALFVDRLASPEFGTRCTARQLQQASAYPIGVARFISKGPWSNVVSLKEVGDTLERLCEVLLRRRGQKWDPTLNGHVEILPLLETVRQRYDDEDRVDAFDQIVGDGTLWLVLCAAVMTKRTSDTQRFGRNLILRDIVQTNVLITTAIPEHLKPLAQRLTAATDMPNLTVMLENIRRSFKDFESFLANNEATLKIGSDVKPEIGDWLWNSNVGFARIEQIISIKKGRVHIPARARTADNVNLSFYTNLRKLSEDDHRVRDHFARCASSLETNVSPSVS